MEQFRHEREIRRKIEETQDIDIKPNPEDIYEPELALEDNDFMTTENNEDMKVNLPYFFVEK